MDNVKERYTVEESKETIVEVMMRDPKLKWTKEQLLDAVEELLEQKYPERGLRK